MKETSKLIPLKVSSKVRKAMVDGGAVLALESTVLTHGLPYPRNFEVLSTLENLCRQHGAEPATIIVLDGVAHIGMDDEDIQNLKDKIQTGSPIAKLGRREIPMALSAGLSGGTTVSATMLLAHYAGIKVFSTGGIGGVHRAWERSMDISSDLKALSQIPVVVVSAGCKAILDIPATLEYLETLGVPVLGWQTDKFPAFYSRNSGLPIDKLTNPKLLAETYRKMMEIDPYPSGILIANPVPEADEIPADVIGQYIDSAIAEADKHGIKGKELTPYLLSALAESTAGMSVNTNLALLMNNVIVGAMLARELR